MSFISLAYKVTAFHLGKALSGCGSFGSRSKIGQASLFIALVTFALDSVARAEAAGSSLTPPVEVATLSKESAPAPRGLGVGSEAVTDSAIHSTTESSRVKTATLLPSLRPVEKPPTLALSGGFQWEPALHQGAIFLVYQHVFRFATERGTREELKGPFIKDYFESVEGLHGWGDSDPFLVNYIGHPMMGSVTGFMYLQNDPRGMMQQFGKSGDYWKSRMRAMAWSAVYSTQFEIGPISEASLGNVGKDHKTAGWVDLVITPLAGTGWLVGEDMLDRYLIRRLESFAGSRTWAAIFRSGLNPTRFFANCLRWKKPWYRDGFGLEPRSP